MGDFIPESILFGFVQLIDFLKRRWILGNQSPFLQQGDDVSQVRLVGEVLDILEERVAGDSRQGVLDPAGDMSMCCTVGEPMGAYTWQSHCDVSSPIVVGSFVEFPGRFQFGQYYSIISL